MTTIDLQTYNPMDRDVQQCPFPHYAALRSEAPVFMHPLTGMYFVSRLETIRQILRDTETFSSRPASAGTMGDPEVMAQVAAISAEGYARVDTLLTCDPPQHTRYRKLIARSFSARRIAQVEPMVREVCDELIDAFPSEGPVDFVKDFAIPFPVKVIARTLNMGPGMESAIKAWSDDSVASLGAALTPERRYEAARGVVEMQHWWAARAEERRAEPQDDILTELVHASFTEPDGSERPLELAEILSIMQQFMVAGNETTTKLLAEGMRLLIENPQWWGRLAEDPALVVPAVEEMLRLSTPNQGMFRKVTADTELDGVEVPKGSMLWIIFGSANRDEATYPEPDAFEPERSGLDNHVAFGLGAHFCPGAPLSRLEARVALEHLTRRLDLPRFAPDVRFTYLPSFILRGLEELKIEVRKR